MFLWIPISKIADFIFPFTEEKEKVFFKVIKEIVEKGYFVKNKLINKNLFLELLKDMVAHDIWFYKAEEGIVTANAKSIYWAFEKLLKESS